MAVGNEEKTMTRAEVAASVESERDLFIIDETVYDASHWKKRHPGGELLINSLRGRDASAPFNSMHPPYVRQKYAITSTSSSKHRTALDYETG